MIEVRDAVDEQRDPTAATRAVVYQSPGQAMIPNWDAHNALRFGYYANTFVYRCIQCIAQDIAGLAFRVGADPDKPNDYDTNNPLARLLGPPPHGPNQTTSARQLWGWTIAQYLATGRWGWELEYGARDQPVALWPLASPYLKPIPTEGGAQYFSKFLFGKPAAEKTLMADRVFYQWRPHAEDWRQPESVLDAARLDISVAVMQDRYDFAFLKNDARPAAVVIYEGFATEVEDRGFKRQFYSDFQGPDNAGKLAFAEADRGDTGVSGALDIRPLGLSQKDARFIERYDAKLRAICVAFGVPLTRLGDASNRTFANAGEEMHMYWQGLTFLIHELADAVNIKLAPLYGQNVGWFDLSKVEALKPPNKFTAPEALQGYDGGLITKNEARTELGLAPVDGGDAFKDTSQQIVLPPPTSVPREAEVETPEPPAPRVLEPDESAIIEARIAERRSRSVFTSTAQLDALERTWQRGFHNLFQRQSLEVLQRLTTKRGRQATRVGDTPRTEKRAQPDPDKIFRRDHWQAITAAETESLVEAAVAAGGGRVAGEFGVAFEMDTAEVQHLITSRANQLAGQVTDTTYSQITDALAQGVEAGESIPEIAARVQAVFDQADALRAPMIARTEVVGAYNGASALGAAQLPPDVVGGQMWVTVEDARTRPAHAAADGEVVAIGEAFVGTGEEMAYPGDPNGSAANTVNCRCTVAFLSPAEMDARSSKVDARSAIALLSMIRAGEQIDEVALRRALREVRAA